MAAYVLSPEQWKELSQDGQPLRRRISRVYYEAHTPVSSPVALNLNVPAPQEPVADHVDHAPYLPQRRSPGQRSQDSGFSGYSDSSEGSSNNSPVPNASASGAAKETPAGAAVAKMGRKLCSSSSLERSKRLMDADHVQQGVLETDLDASGSSRHVSRVYIRGGSPDVNLNIRDVMCEKKIKAVNLSTSHLSADKSVADKSLINSVLAQPIRCRMQKDNEEADRSCDSLAPLLEHKSLPQLKPNLSWKKLGESFRKVLSSSVSSSRTGSPTIHAEEDSTATQNNNNNKKRQVPKSDEEDRNESPTPTTRYLGGPRSSTPRKNQPARRRRCSHLNDEPQPVLRVHWADSYHQDNWNTDTEKLADWRRRQATGPSAGWPDNSTWDSDTPSLEIGHGHLNLAYGDYQPPMAHFYGHQAAPQAPANGSGERKFRRGLRMGVGGERTAAAKRPVTDSRNCSSLAHQSCHLTNGLRWSPVEAWLKDLPMFYQPESTCALQNKAIGRVLSAWSCDSGDDDDELDASRTVILANQLQHQSDDEDRTYTATVLARSEVRRLQRRAHVISTEFAQLCSFIELYEESKLAALIPIFLAHVIQFIRETEGTSPYSRHQTKESAANDQLVASLRHTCTELVQIVTFTNPLDMEPGLQTPPIPVNWSLARQVTAKLGQIFVAIVDTFVGKEIQVLTDALKSGKCISAAKLAANSLMSLGPDAAKPALEPLIQAFQCCHLRPVRSDLLRALAALCSTADIIQEFELVGGLAVIFEVLCNSADADVEEKSEAAGLLAQITSPWLEPPQPTSDGQNAWPTLHLTPYISSFIAALTDLARRTETEETLLLSTAALANLTFSHAEAVPLMAKYRTAQVLVRASSTRKELSIFIQDQIATILANMAAVYSARADIVSNGALATLTSFLQLRPSPMQRPAEVAACERVLKKSAIAISRVCGQENAAREIVQLRGIDRLAQLVRDPRERNHSDGVLVACLAALHKIATACGTEELQQRGACDLVENRLLDVFLEYSSRPESYV